MGSNTLAAKYYGAGDKKELHKTVHTSMLLSIISGVLLTVVGVFGARTILIWMQTPANVLDLAAAVSAHLLPGHDPHHGL